MIDVGELITRAQISQRMLSIGLGCEREVMLEAGYGVVNGRSTDLLNLCYSVAVAKYLSKTE